MGHPGLALVVAAVPKALIIVASVLGGLVVLFLILGIVFGAVRRALRRAVQDRFSPVHIRRQEIGANFFGQTSKGARQVRGNGALVLTEEQLWFRLALPAREWDIPLRDIILVDTKRSHLGKSCLWPLLFVEFHTEHGADSIAWAVRDAEGWREDIEQSRLAHTHA